MLEALFAQFLVSDISEKDSQGLFNEYEGKYMVMSIESPLLQEVV